MKPDATIEHIPARYFDPGPQLGRLTGAWCTLTDRCPNCTRKCRYYCRELTNTPRHHLDGAHEKPPTGGNA